MYPKIILTWEDRNVGEDGHKIYRSTTPIDLEALPAPLATLPANASSYEDLNVLVGQTYYYIVSVFRGGEEKFSYPLTAAAFRNKFTQHNILWDEYNSIISNPVVSVATLSNDINTGVDFGAFGEKHELITNMVMGPDGLLYVASRNNVLKINPSTRVTEKILIDGQMDDSPGDSYNENWRKRFDKGFLSPTGKLVFTPAGGTKHITLVDVETKAIEHIPFPTNESRDMQFTSPVMDSLGKIYWVPVSKGSCKYFLCFDSVTKEFSFPSFNTTFPPDENLPMVGDVCVLTDDNKIIFGTEVDLNGVIDLNKQSLEYFYSKNPMRQGKAFPGGKVLCYGGSSRMYILDVQTNSTVDITDSWSGFDNIRITKAPHNVPKFFCNVLSDGCVGIDGFFYFLDYSNTTYDKYYGYRSSSDVTIKRLSVDKLFKYDGVVNLLDIESVGTLPGHYTCIKQGLDGVMAVLPGGDIRTGQGLGIITLDTPTSRFNLDLSMSSII